MCATGRFRAAGPSVLLLRGHRLCVLEPGLPHSLQGICTLQDRCVPKDPAIQLRKLLRVLPVLQSEFAVMNSRNKSIFSAFGYDCISQVICVIFVIFSFNKAKLKSLLCSCPALQSFCGLTILLSRLSASAMVTIAFLMLSSFTNEIPLNCYFLTEKTLYKDPLPVFVYNKLKPTSEML